MLLECREVIFRLFQEMHRLFGQQLYPKRTDCTGLPSAGENPQISAEQMADAVGYHDEKYFVKLFQQSMGIGFAEYKKQLKRQEF